MSEQELAKLSYPDAPKIVSETIPGPKAQESLGESFEFESMARGGGRFPFVFSEGKGATVRDPDGNVMIDITAGVAVNSVGRCHPRVVETMKNQMETLMHASDISNVKRTELAKKISTIAPPGLRDNCVTYFTQDGSGAVETALKFCRKITGRTQVVAFHGAYHGVWMGGNSLTTGDQYRKGYGPFIPGVIHLPYPYCYRCCFGLEYPSCNLQCAKYVDYVLNTPYTGADDVGALIIEAQQGEGGYLPPPPGYLEIVKKACEKHGALYISDEVQAGAGRTGKMWCIEHTEVKPDMITWGKGMGGDVPMAGLTIRKDLAEQIVDHSQPNTWAGNAVASAACLTNIEILTENDRALINRAAELGRDIREMIREGSSDIRVIGDVRGRGLMIGIEMVEDRETRAPLGGDGVGQIVMGMLNRGMLMVPCGRFGNVFRFMPPLVLTRDYARKAVEILLEVARHV
ncbi:aminotransferase class III-fold pyridoxal phosphate-dependent enzyme [Desulforhopalus singaporensis]|uniref:aminotransferase class III-fold pyridoxal phosphate-dependent enzyme n=1 Tax=Desulforhopalus singaporensis TaxID=91360 RepID=UPI000B89E632